MHALAEEEAERDRRLRGRAQARRRGLQGARATAATSSLCEGTDFGGAAPGARVRPERRSRQRAGRPGPGRRQGRLSRRRRWPSVRPRAGRSCTRAARSSASSSTRVPDELVREVSRRLAAEDDGRARCTSCRSVPSSPTRPWARWLPNSAPASSSSPPDGLQREVRDVRVGADQRRALHRQSRRGHARDRPRRSARTSSSRRSRPRSHPAIPTVSGVVLTEGYPLDETIRAAAGGARPSPVLETPAADPCRGGRRSVVEAAHPTRERAQDRGRPGPLRGRRRHRRSSSAGSRSERPARVTPIMFEYELIERAKARPAHIVLPEGDDDRVLRAAEILLRRGVVDVDHPRRSGRDGGAGCLARCRSSAAQTCRPARLAAARRLRRPLLRAAQAQGRHGGAGVRRRRATRATSGR